jgi:hypothetical protein
MSTPAPGAVIAGRYRVVGPLGQGAMGVVVRAHDPGAGRDVAIKLLTAAGPGRAERLRREAQLAARLDHPGIVRVHDAGEADGAPFVVFELVEGARTLRAAWAELDARGRAGLLRDAGRALGHAHARGVVHRDVKPDNILVDAAGRARVTDFGLATAAGVDPLTRSGAVLGTPLALSPEQVRGGAAGPASDVWALGVALYEALTDRPPFEGDTLLELTGAILACSPAPPRAARPTVPASLEAVCLGALRLAPADRFPDGEAFAAALDRALAGRARDPVRALALLAGLAVALGAAALARAGGRPWRGALPASVASDALASPTTSAAPAGQPRADAPTARTYDLRAALDAREPRRSGQRTRISRVERQDTRLVALDGGPAPQRQRTRRGYSASWVDEVEEVDAQGDTTRLRRVYERFADADGADVPCAGLVAQLTIDPDGGRTWARAGGGELPAPIRALLGEQATKAKAKAAKARPELTTQVLPAGPVAEGATWDLGLERLTGIAGVDSADIVVERSSAAIRFDGIERAGASRVAVITGVLELTLRSIQGLPCPEPASLHLDLDIRLPLDEGSRMRTARSHGTFQGMPALLGLRAEVEVDMLERRERLD